MKRLLALPAAIAMLAACSPSPEKVREQCLKDKDNFVFYGESTSLYCDCLYGKLKAAADNGKLTKNVVDSIKNECDAEFTSLETEF